MKLLLCSDGSEQGERCVRVGAAVAAGVGAEVTLLGISERRGESKSLLESLGRSQTLLQDKRVQCELVTRSGEPIEEIRRQTREHHYDLVVIGAVRKQPLGLYWMSSKSYKIIKAIQPPVLSVAGKITAIKRILICSGGKRFIENAVRLTGTIARGTGAAVSLLHVMPEAPAIFAHLPRMEESVPWLLRSSSELGLNLKHEKELLEKEGVPVEIRLRDGSVLEEILREVNDGGYDLVVTGSAPSLSLRSYVLGDISREIVNRTSCAVLVTRSEFGPEDSAFGFGRFWR
jgi:nucleotide-binding universal stress UspA family protein